MLANDVDPDGDALTAFLNTTTTEGHLVVPDQRQLHLHAQCRFRGQRHVHLHGHDGKGSFDTATVTITVANVNQVPDAKDDAFSTLRNTAVSGNVLTNTNPNGPDTDPDGDKLFASLAAAPTNGNVVLNSDGSFSYTPNAGFVGTDTFTYKASDGLDTDTATVKITVTRAGRSGRFGRLPSPLRKTPRSPATCWPTTSIRKGTSSRSISTTAPSSGTLITDSAGNFTYTPFPNFFGTDSFTYTIQDAKGVTDTAKVTLTFTPVNDIDAVNDIFSTDEDKSLTRGRAGRVVQRLRPRYQRRA